MKVGWKVKTLGEVCTLQRGFDLPTTQRTTGVYPLVTSSGPTDTHSEYKVEGPGVVTGRSGSIGNVYYVDDNFWPLNTALYVKDFHGNDPKFVWYLLQYFDLSRFSTGAGVPTLNRNDVHGEAVYAPNSADEQKRIVAVLDTAFEGLTRARAHTETNLKNARELFGKVLEEQFSQLPSETASFEEICSDTLIGLVRNTHEQGDNLTYPYVKMNNISTFGTFDVSKLARVDCTVAELQRYRLEVGDFLFNTRNSYELVGKTCLFSDELNEAAVFNNNIMRVRFKPHVDPRFITFAFQTSAVKDRIKAFKSGTTSVVGIYHKSLKGLRLPLPTLEVQHSLVEKLTVLSDQTESLQSNCRAKLADLDGLRQALLQKAFAGELT